MRRSGKITLSLSIVLFLLFGVGMIIYERKPINSDLIFIQWIFFTIRYPQMLLVNQNHVLVYFWITWYAIVTLIIFCLGYQIQNGKVVLNKKAMMKNRDAHMKALKVYNIFKQCNYDNYNRAKRLLYKLKVIEEKLSVETDFGYGDDELTLCENKIGALLEQLLNYTEKFDGTLCDTDVDRVFQLISEIEVLLEQRHCLDVRE